MGSVQYWRRPQRVQCSPRHTLSNCSQAASINEASSVSIPASKLRRLLLFIPMPAPVRLAEPMLADSKSNISILKWTRGHSIRSSPVFRIGYRSKSSRKAGPGSFAWMSLTSTPRLSNLASTARNGSEELPALT